MIARLHTLSSVVAFTLLAAVVSAQQGAVPGSVPGGSGQAPGASVPSPPPPPLEEPVYRDVLDPQWTQPPAGHAFQGFPVFPSRLFGYGNYPTDGKGPGGLTRNPRSQMPLLMPASPQPPGWPSWVRTRNKEPLPYAPDVALLIRHGDRVWYRSSAEPVFVPLFPHDKFRTLGAGAEVEVRQQGNFELLLHDSSRLRANGPSRLRLVELAESAVRVEVPELTRLLITAGRRAHTIVLPDGSELRVAAPTPDDESQGPAELLLERADEPGWFGGRATLSNRGKRTVQWHHATGDVALAPDERVTLFLSPPQHAMPVPLQATGVTMQAVGGVCHGQSPGGGEVHWCGASFVLPAGATLRLESLQGDAFAPAPTKSGT